MRNPLGYAVRVDYHLVCNRCGVEAEAQPFFWSTLDDLAWPSKPRGWQVLNGYLVCDQHDIIVEDKDDS